MFSWLFKKDNKKRVKRAKTYVYKHCKLSCETCNAMFCYSCHSNIANPCPRCGKTNLMEKESLSL
ncbi:hypothetical protein [Aliarcobacter skirrowii]|uniref:hypothetical protein n=1 Tax=Aliarcobacter skirrowii TaxID=28200 RepID=UPI00299FE4D0|nr:hypothetical protein [Aliarcobacter skirrowii]MDX4027439.1 hypothetical protein [Aliarcobacter skirrowii]